MTRSGRLLTTSEVAELIASTPAALKQMRQRGTGPRYIKLDTRVRYAPADVMAWVNEGRQKAQKK